MIERSARHEQNATAAVTCAADIERLEQVPLRERGLPASTYELLRSAADKHPQDIAIRYIENGDTWKAAVAASPGSAALEITYAQLLANIHRTANLFRVLGVGEQDPVSMILPNVPQAHYTLWGGEACGVVNPVNHMLSASEIGDIVHSAGSTVIVVYGPHEHIDVWQKLPGILARAPRVEHVLVAGANGAALAQRCIDFDAALQEQPAQGLTFDRVWAASDTASLFHTGGTTGLPKLARHTHGNEVYTVWAVNRFIGDDAQPCYLTGLPLFHCNAAIGSGLSVFMRGGTVLLAGINGFRSLGIVANLFALVEYYRVTNFNAVPTVIALLAQLPVEPFDLSSMRFAVCGAAPLPVELFNRFVQHTGIPLLEGYGLTEATVCCSLTPSVCDAPRIGSIGLRIPYTQMKAAVLGDGGRLLRDCAVDEVGVLLIRGPSVTPGYTDPARNAGLFVRDAAGDAWLNSGDLARQDGDGYFWLTGRQKELIIRGGHNIDPKCIEEALAAHPAVNMAAAVGRPDKYAGELPVAYVDTRSATSEGELLAWCEQTIGERAAIPKAVVILEQLPLTGIGKIHKPTLLLREIETVARNELAPLHAHFEQLQVHAECDAKYGNTVHIALASRDPAASEDIRQQIAALLGDYSFRCDVQVR